MAYSTFEDLSAHFTAAELAVIDEHAYVDAWGGRDNALSLTVSWGAHVDKLDRDRSVPYDDHSVGTEHDLVAAYLDHNAEEFVCRNIRVIVNYDEPWLSTAYEIGG
jgi:hypothetical protein